MAVIHIHPDLFKFLERTQSNIISQLLVHQGEYILPDADCDWVKKENADLDMISYIPKSKSKFISHPDPYQDNKCRTNMKIGRFVRRILNIDQCVRVGLNDKKIEEFVNLIKSYYSSDETKLRVIEGDEILKYYDQSSYGSVNGHNSGTLWSSCMRYREKNKFMEIYAKNPKDCKMLIYMDANDKLRARALLWENALDKYGNSYKVMDRIYSLYDHDVNFFKEWASKNGYLSKTEQTSKSEQYFTRDGKNIRLHLYLKLENFKFKTYPYFDTFKFFDPKNGTFANSENFSYQHYLVQNWGGLEPEQRDNYGFGDTPDLDDYGDDLQDEQSRPRSTRRQTSRLFGQIAGSVYIPTGAATITNTPANVTMSGQQSGTDNVNIHGELVGVSSRQEGMVDNDGQVRVVVGDSSYSQERFQRYIQERAEAAAQKLKKSESKKSAENPYDRPYYDPYEKYYGYGREKKEVTKKEESDLEKDEKDLLKHFSDKYKNTSKIPYDRFSESKTEEKESLKKVEDRDVEAKLPSGKEVKFKVKKAKKSGDDFFGFYDDWYYKIEDKK